MDTETSEWTEEDDETFFEKTVDKPSSGRKKKNNTPFHLYGDEWDGKFMKVAEMAALIPSFKEFYIQSRRADLKESAMEILRKFNKKVAPLGFYPYPSQFRIWRTKWDKAILLELGVVEANITEAKRINDVVKVRDAERAVTLVPGEEELEHGVQTLGGMLVNDAVGMLQDDKELEDIYTSDEIVKRKTYALNVFAHVTRHVHGKEALKIKKHAEGRETAGFLMNLLNRAKAGKVSEADLVVLDGAAVETVVVNEQPA